MSKTNWNTTNEELAAMGFPVERWGKVVGCRVKLVEGTTREAAVKAAQAAGLLGKVEPTQAMLDQRWAEQRAAMAGAWLDAEGQAEIAAWLATPGNVVGNREAAAELRRASEERAASGAF